MRPRGLEPGQDTNGLLTGIAADGRLSLETATDPGALGQPKQLALVVIIQLDTGNTSRLPVRHARYGR